MSPEPVPLQVLTWPSGRELARRLPRLLAGIVILGIGIAPILDAELGVAPWDVLHQGLSDVTGLASDEDPTLVLEHRLRERQNSRTHRIRS